MNSILQVRDLRKAKREVDLRLVDREDQVEDLAQQVCFSFLLYLNDTWMVAG